MDKPEFENSGHFLSSVIMARVKIAEVVKYYCPTYREGSALCRCISPGHNDSTASMKVYSDTNSCYCFGCGFSGNVISVTAKLENCTNKQALLILKKRYNIEENLADISLKEKSNFLRNSQMFDKNFEFYTRTWAKKGYSLANSAVEQLEDIYQAKDIAALKAFNEAVNQHKVELL